MLPRARWAQVLRWLAVCSAGAVCAHVMVGCAVPGKEALGSARADVAARLGPPTAMYPRPEGGERWQYSELPAGVQVYNLDFDATGRLVRNAPALTQVWLEQIPVGQWTVSDVRYWLGAPPAGGARPGLRAKSGRTGSFSCPTRALPTSHIDPSGTVQRVLFGRCIQRPDDRP